MANHPNRNKRPILAIVMEGGVIQEIIADRPDAFRGFRIITIDYDTDGVDEAGLIEVPQGDDTAAPAVVNQWHPAGDAIGVATILRLMRERDRRVKQTEGDAP